MLRILPPLSLNRAASRARSTSGAIGFVQEQNGIRAPGRGEDALRPADVLAAGDGDFRAVEFMVDG